MNERLCEWDRVQTEKHVLQDCPRPQHIRDHHHFDTLEQVFSDKFSMTVTCKTIHGVLPLPVNT